jgi:hypothetical protein
MRTTFLKAGFAAACLVLGMAIAGSANALVGGFSDESLRSFNGVSQSNDDDMRVANATSARASDDAESEDERGGTARSAGTSTSPRAAAGTMTPVVAGGNAAPVGSAPEPETYAMMALGLVLIGVVARRRKE